jgi:hypothetical protein
MRIVFGVLGVIIALFSLILVTVALVELLGWKDGKTETSILAGIFVGFSGATLCGAYLSWRMFRHPAGVPTSAMPVRRQVVAPRSAPVDAIAEKRVLAIAVGLGGRITVTEAAARCDLTVPESRRVLDRLVSQGVAEMLIAADGTIVYAILGLLSPDAKAAASNLTSR